MFKPGQKIICVKDNGYVHSHPGIDAPSKNEIVTVHGYCNIYPEHIDIKEYLRTKSGRLHSFGAYRFRPLDEVLEEISIEEVKEILETVPA